MTSERGTTSGLVEEKALLSEPQEVQYSVRTYHDFLFIVAALWYEGTESELGQWR